MLAECDETGRWDLVELLTSESGDRNQSVMSIAANDSEVLVVTQSASPGATAPTHPEAPDSIPFATDYTAWIIDPSDGVVSHHALPVSASEWTENSMGLAHWFDGEWLIAVTRDVWTDTDEGWSTPTPVLTSADGRSWTLTQSNFPADSATSISVGPSSVIATECNFGGDTFWYSDNAVDWEIATTSHAGHRSVYVDNLGFITYYKGSPTAYSPDGREWQAWATAGITLTEYDGIDDPHPTVGSLFVAEDRLVWWSTNGQPNEGEGMG